MSDEYLKAVQGEDTLDLLQHIAWTDVVKPKLEEARTALTQRLVEATLKPHDPKEESREQLAGKLFGIDFMIKAFERVLREGANAKDYLAKQNVFLRGL